MTTQAPALNTILIRPAEPGDMSFIYATWMNSYRYYSPLGKSCRNDIFFENYERVIDHLLLNKSKAIIAHIEEAPDVILSYMVFEPPNILHYTFTKGAFLRLGLARALFQHAFGSAHVEYTHKTFNSNLITDGKDNRLTFNPFHIYNIGDTHGR